MSKLQLKRGSSGTLGALTEALAAGEPVYCKDTKDLRIGDGTSLWSALKPLVIEANIDGKQYVRKDGAWVEIAIPATNFLALSDTPDAYEADGRFVIINSNALIFSAYSMPAADGTDQQVLMTNGSGMVSWGTVNAGTTLPSQSGQSGKILSTDGANPSWISAPSSLPSMTGNSGKLLSTDGSNAMWVPASTGGGGGIEEAPLNNKTYGRRNAAWVEVTSSGSSGSGTGDVDGGSP